MNKTVFSTAKTERRQKTKSKFFSEPEQCTLLQAEHSLQRVKAWKRSPVHFIMPLRAEPAMPIPKL